MIPTTRASDWQIKVTPVKDVDTKTLTLFEHHLYKRARFLLKSGWIKPEDSVLKNFRAYAVNRTLFDRCLGFGYKVVFNYNGKNYLLIFNRG